MNKKKKIREIEGAEYGVDSRYASKNVRLAEGKVLMEARLQKLKELPDDHIVRARLMQLKLQMEEYFGPQAEVIHPEVLQSGFTDFLKSYIDTLYSKRNIFAKDMDISPVRNPGGPRKSRMYTSANPWKIMGICLVDFDLFSFKVIKRA